MSAPLLERYHVNQTLAENNRSKAFFVFKSQKEAEDLAHIFTRTTQKY